MHVRAVPVPAFCASRADRPNRIEGKTSARYIAVWARSNRSQGAGGRAGTGCAPRSCRRRQWRGARSGRHLVHGRDCRAHGGPGAVVRDPRRSVRSGAGTGGPPPRPGHLCRSGGREGGSGLHGGRTAPRRPHGGRRRTGAPADGGIAPPPALRRRKRHAGPRHPALAAHGRGIGFWAADRKSDALADFCAAVEPASRSRHWPRPLAGRIDPRSCGRMCRFRAGGLRP